MGFAVFQTIVQDSGNHIHVIRICGLGLNDRRQRDNLVHGVAAGLNIGLKVLNAVLKVVEEAAQRHLYRFVLKEIVRVGEQITLELVVFLVSV